MKRAEKVAEAQRLRAEGLLVRQIAERMGVAASTAQTWIADPDLSRQRARRERYRGVCVDCGAPTDGAGGYARSPERCQDCDLRFRRENAYWTAERIVDAVRAWVAEHGEVPKAPQWRTRQGRYPATCTVQEVMGSWNEAIEAAGFTPRQLGHYGRPGEDLAFCNEVRRAYEAGESACQLGRRYGCCPGAVLDRVRKAGGRARSLEEAQQLRVARNREAIAA